jgi:hypothetical protein
LLAGTLLAPRLTGLPSLLPLLARLLAAATTALIRRRLTLALLTLTARLLALTTLACLAALLAALRPRL